MSLTLTLESPCDLPCEDMPGLLERIAAGEPDAWETVCDRYRRHLLSIGRSFRLPADEVADALQETWLKLLRHAGAIRDPERLGGWLSQVMRNECRAAAVRAGRRVLLPEWEEAPVVDVTTNVENDAVDRILHATLAAALRQLPAHQRRLVHALFLSPAASYEEIGEALGVPVGSIGPTRARALARLRVLLAREGLDAWVAVAA